MATPQQMIDRARFLKQVKENINKQRKLERKEKAKAFVKSVSSSYKKASQRSERVGSGVKKAFKGTTQAFKASGRLSGSLLNIGAGFSGQRVRGAKQRVQAGPGRPAGEYKHRSPFTGQPIPATEFYKQKREFRRLQQQKAQQVDQQAIQQLAKRGIPPEQAQQVVDTRQLRSIGVQPQIQNGVVPMPQNEAIRRQLAMQEMMRQQQLPQQIQQGYPSKALRPIWRRQNVIRTETDAFGNVKQVQGGNDPRNFWQ